MKVDAVNLMIYAISAVFLLFVLREAAHLLRLCLNTLFTSTPRNEAEQNRLLRCISTCSARAANLLLALYDRCAPWRTTLILFSSILIPILAITVGRFLEAGAPFHQTLPSLIPYSHSFYRTEFLFPFIFFFFYPTVRLTFRCLRSLARLDRGVMARAAVLLLNLILDTVFAFITLLGAKCLPSLQNGGANDEADLLSVAFERAVATWRMFLTTPVSQWFTGGLDWDAFLLSIPPFVPTAIYFSVFIGFLAFDLIRGLPEKGAAIFTAFPCGAERKSAEKEDEDTAINVIYLPHDADPTYLAPSESTPPKGKSLFRRIMNRMVRLIGVLQFPVKVIFRFLRRMGVRNIVRVAGCCIMLGFLGFTWLYISLPDVGQSQDILNHTTIVIKKTGSDIRIKGIRKSLPVTYSTLPKYLTKALLTMEDRRFMEHFGFDIRGICRATLQLLRTGSFQSGGSTVTQQLAKNLYLSNDRKIVRKIMELILALKIEMRYSKEEILEMYFNHVFLGGTCHGIEAAAREYFQKRAENLNLYESCMIVGSIPLPNKRNLHSKPENAHRWANIVLEKMAETGAISLEQAKQARRTGIRAGSRVLRSVVHNYFFDWIKPDIRKYCGDIDGELTVVTTLNPEIQLYGNLDTTRVLRRLDIPKTSQVALLAMSPDGAVRAMIGGRNYQESQYNRTVQALRQPGSLFKAFVYLAALEKGWLPEHQIFDTPDGDNWPKNWDGKYMGRITMIDAMKTSRNAATVGLAKEIGIPAVIAVARRLGIERDMPKELGLALGQAEVSMMEITAAYAAFANGGRKVTPFGVTLIRDGLGNVLYQHIPYRGRKVIQPQDLHNLNRMLAAVVGHGGTGKRAAFKGHPPIAGKTGTTSDNRDAWFCGYSAQLITSVWLGNDDNSPMENVTGGGAPALVWREFNYHVHHHLDLKPRPLP